MKKLITAFGILLSGTLLIAQPTSGGPDNFGYTFKTSAHTSGPTYNWFDISSSGTLITNLGDDNFVGPFPISNFTYYNGTPSQFWIGSNGFISFNPVNIASTNAAFPAIPTVGGPNGFIAPFLTDLTFAGASSNPAAAFWYDQGDTICISFEKVPFWVNNSNQYAGENTFQIILNRADSSITFNYKTQIGLPDPTYVNNFISIGIEDQTGSDGLQFIRGNTFPAINSSVRYEFPTIIQPVTDLEMQWVGNEKSASDFVPLNANFTPTVNIKNSGNQAVTGNINVTYLATNSSGFIVGIGNSTVAGLGVGQDTSIVLGSGFSPTTTGKYKIEAYVSGVAADVLQSNDTNAMKLIVVDTSLLVHTLDYTDGIPNGGSLGWSGGNGGVAIYVEPPYYPARIVGSNFYITTTGANQAGFHSVIYDDNGRLGAPGTTLDSVFIPGSNIIPNSYTNITATNNIVINSGGVYLLWLMGADGINIGRTIESPGSRRTYEVLFGAWSDYRGLDVEDFLLNLEVEAVSVGIDETQTENKLAVYPNPAIDQVWIEISNEKLNQPIQIFNQEGKLVQAKVLKYHDKIQLLRSNLPGGIYHLSIGGTSTQILFQD